ncbi:hypothetical protein M0D69_13645 [Caballeronia sp. SEWSISQ10-4 2]|uniref:hypothetical protein n=1 Tax=Caballeronia sp. SEWSISQ10-4 2 TaxID=2937438 RepID=UPI002650F5E0|nr:hypothetical protein [Caballeronia sp. SEWSISQ10-4 2]MDN7179039.1 hypothetical protein [Caballeronia sp. SEWSISQ10-4 2]
MPGQEINSAHGNELQTVIAMVASRSETGATSAKPVRSTRSTKEHGIVSATPTVKRFTVPGFESTTASPKMGVAHNAPIPKDRRRPTSLSSLFF